MEKAFAEAETEKVLRLGLESNSAMKKMQEGELEKTLALDKKDRSATLFSVWGWEISGANLELSPREDRVSAEGTCGHGLHISVLTD